MPERQFITIKSEKEENGKEVTIYDSLKATYKINVDSFNEVLDYLKSNADLSKFDFYTLKIYKTSDTYEYLSQSATLLRLKSNTEVVFGSENLFREKQIEFSSHKITYFDDGEEKTLDDSNGEIVNIEDDYVIATYFSQVVDLSEETLKKPIRLKKYVYDFDDNEIEFAEMCLNPSYYNAGQDIRNKALITQAINQGWLQYSISLVRKN